MNIFELFGKMQDFDDGMLEDVSFEDHALLTQDTQRKIDSYYEVVMRLQSESERFDKAATILKEKSRRLDNQVTRIKAYLLTACQVHGVEEFPGFNHKLKVISRKSIVAQMEADSVMFARYPGICKQRVNVEFKWDKDALEKAFKEGNTEIAKVVLSEYVRFY